MLGVEGGGAWAWEVMRRMAEGESMVVFSEGSEGAGLEGGVSSLIVSVGRVQGMDNVSGGK